MTPSRRSLKTPFIPLVAAMLITSAFICFLPGCSKTPEDHARIARTHKNPEKRIASVEALAAAGNQALLANVAEYAGYMETCIEAARRLEDQRLLADFARNAYNYNNYSPVFPIVVEKISDPQTLADLMRNARNEYIRIEAACALGDQPALAEFMRKNLFGKPAALIDKVSAKLTDQTALADVAKNGRTGPIRKLAVSRLADQQALAEIVRSDPDHEVRISAIDRLADRREQQQALMQLVENGRGEKIRMQALQKLSDQQLLAEIAKTMDASMERMQNGRFGDRIRGEAAFAQMLRDSEDRSIAVAALNKITDPELLADIALSAGYVEIRKGAVEKITDMKLLARLAMIEGNSGDSPHKRSADSDVAWTAFRKITDQETLADIVMNVSPAGGFLADRLRDEIRTSALKKITGQQLLVRIAGNTTAADDYLRLEAMDMLTDQQALANIAARDRDESAVWRALDRLDTLPPAQAPLAGLARAADTGIRLWAVWRLDDQDALAGIAQNDAAEHVRNAATARLAGKPEASAPENITDLIKDGKLVVKIRGGIDADVRNLYMTYRKTIPGPLEAVIPAGTYFTSPNKAVRNMVSLRDVFLPFEKTGWPETVIPAVDASKGKRPPSKDDTFAPVALPDGSELKKLAVFLGKRKETSFLSAQDEAIRQASVWIVTDNTSYSDLHSLILETRGGGSVTTKRMIYELEAAEAMRLCAEAGIDIKQKRIWNDRRQILAGLAEGELKSWLETL